MANEVFSWPEGNLYLYPSGNVSALQAYVQDVRIGVSWTWQKTVRGQTGTFASRSQFTLSALDVTVNIGQLYSTANMWRAAASATAYNVKLELTQEGELDQTAVFLVESAVFQSLTLEGGEGQLFKHSLSMIAADISASGT